MTGFNAHIADGSTASHDLVGRARMIGPRWLHLPALTGGLLGVSVFWSVEMTYAPPYLLSLGVSKAHMAIVFAAGPLSGLLVQPVIGVLSDTCRSRWGRRRPYIALGTLFCVGAMLLLGFTRPVASIFTPVGTAANDSLTIFMAVLAIYFVDFSINAVMAVDRSLVVDTLPAEEQITGNAWATYMAVVGGVVGLYIGVVDLPKVLPWLGSSQLQGLAILASLLFFGTHAAAVIVVREKVLLADGEGSASGLIHQLRQLWSTAMSLPSTIQRIFAIQFFASIAWFPIFNYLTVYVSDLYAGTFPRSPVPDAAVAAARAAEGTRLGTRALFFSAVVSLVATLLLPPFVVGGAGGGAPGTAERLLMRMGVRKVPKMHLATLWAVTFWAFAACMLATVFVTEVSTATLIITVTGLPGAIGQWAPYALVGEVIRESDAAGAADDGTILMSERRRESLLFDAEEDAEREGFLSRTADDALESPDDQLAHSPLGADAVLGHPVVRMGSLDSIRRRASAQASPPEKEVKANLGAKAGAILAMLNLFVVIPQFIVTALAAFVFALVEPSSSDSGASTPDSDPTKDDKASAPNAVGLIFRVGGVSAVVAGVLAWKLAGQLKRHMGH